MPHFDLVVVGTGSGNSIPGREFDDWNIAIVETGGFGGTCLNVGCIPTKMYVYPADLAEAARRGGRSASTATVDSVDWPAMRDRIFARVDEIEASGRAYREGPKWPNTTVYAGTGRFTGPQGDDRLAERRRDRRDHRRPVRASRPAAGRSSRTSRGWTRTRSAGVRCTPRTRSCGSTSSRRRLLIVGGGYIAAEFAHIFASFGTR